MTNPSGAQKLPNPDALPWSLYIGVLGLPGQSPVTDAHLHQT